MSTLSGRAPSDNKILGRKTLPCCKKGAHVLGEQIQQLRHQNIHGSYTHAEMHTHKGLHFFNSHCAPDKNCSKRVSDSPFESPYFFWRFSQTNSTGVLFYCTKETEAVRGKVPDHFKAGLLLLNDFIPFKSPERGRMNEKGPYSRRANLGKQ